MSSSCTRTCPVCSAILSSNECRLCSYKEVKLSQREIEERRICEIFKRFDQLDGELKLKFLVRMMGSVESLADAVFNHVMDAYNFEDMDDTELSYTLGYLEEGHKVIDELVEKQILGQV